MSVSRVTIRPARRDDVPEIVAMLADDPLGRGRECIEDPLPPSYFIAFASIEADSNIQLMVAEDADGSVVGCLQLCILPGLSSQGSSRGLIEDVRVAARCRSQGVGEQMNASLAAGLDGCCGTGVAFIAKRGSLLLRVNAR
jgi:ribosomal protein S18 acetylase RimI-like enzyme